MAKATIVPLTDEAFAAASAVAERARVLPTAVLRAIVRPIGTTSLLGLSLDLRNGASVTIPISAIEELSGQPAEELKKVAVDPLGEGLLWSSLDVGISAPGLLEDFFGSVTRAKIARAGGRRSTPAKAAAARANGQKGGRKKHAHA
jgi:hypothetical protein